MTIRPLGSVRLLRRYVTVAVAIAMIYLFVQILRHPLPNLTHGSWRGFWAGSDAALAVAVSWIPVASDYSRHSRSSGAAFGAATVGYSVTQVFCYLMGLLALANVNNIADNQFQPFLAVPLGAVFFAVLVLREVDQSFTNVYSTGVSLQNLFPRADRRVLTVAIGALTMVLALVLNIDSYTQLPDADRLGVRADVRRAGRGLLPRRPLGALGHVGAGAVALGDARGLAARVGGLPVDQSGQCRRVVDDVVVAGQCAALHAAGLDERVVVVVRGVRARGVPGRPCHRTAKWFNVEGLDQSVYDRPYGRRSEHPRAHPGHREWAVPAAGLTTPPA